MSVRVTIRRKNEEVPEDFVYSVLMSTLRMSREEYEKIRGEDGSVSVYVNDPKAILKLQEISERYSEFLDIIFEKGSAGGVFSSSIEAVKSNWGLAFSWSAVVFVLLLLSMVPILGFFASVLMNVFVYAFIIYASSRLLNGSVDRVFKSLSLGEAFSKHMASGFGMWLGFLVIGIGFLAVSLILVFAFGALGGISDLVNYGRVREGALISVTIVLLLILIVGLWYIYALPLLVAKLLEKGEPNFERSFLAPFNIIKPSFVRETFSNWYLRVGGIWSVGVTAGMTGALLLSILIITIPAALLIIYWMNVLFAICSAESVRRG